MTKIVTALTFAIALGLPMATASADDGDPIRLGCPSCAIDTAGK